MSENNKIENNNEISFMTLDAIMDSWENAIGIDRITLEIAGDLASAAILTRLRYWFGPSRKDGQSRSKIRKEGKLWLARKDDEWWEECGVTTKQVRRIKEHLNKLGLVETKVFRFNGLTVMHWHFNIQKFVELYNKHISNKVCASAQRDKPDLPKGTKRSCPKGNSINKNSIHDPYTNSLSKHKNKDCVSRDVQLSLINENLDVCFSCIAEAIDWLHNFGFKEELASKLAREHFMNLKPSVVYLKKQMKKKDVDSLTGYLIQIIENKWYLTLPKRKHE